MSVSFRPRPVVRPPGRSRHRSGPSAGRVRLHRFTRHPWARPRGWLLAVDVALLSLVLVVVAVRVQFAAAEAGELPVTVRNNSGSPGPVFVYVIARRAGRQGYVDGSGNWRPFALPSGGGRVPAPDLSVAGPANGSTQQIWLPPDLAGGRIYVSVGARLPFFLTPGGLVEPAPWASGDPSRDVLFDWAEFARSGSRIFVNTTMVDMFALPLSVTVQGVGARSRTEGDLLGGGRADVIRAFEALGGDGARLVYRRPSDGFPLRVLAPAHGLAAGLVDPAPVQQYVGDVWTYYRGHPLTVRVGAATYRGTVTDAGMRFTDSGGAAIGVLPRPTAAEVFGCSGSLQPQGQPNRSAILAVGAVVCAGLHRGTLSTPTRTGSDLQPATDSRTFYTAPGSDRYAALLHRYARSGRVYAFAYDDVAGFAPTIDEPQPTSAALTLGPLGATGGTVTPTGPGTPTSGSAPTGGAGVPTGPAPGAPTTTAAAPGPGGCWSSRRRSGPSGRVRTVRPGVRVAPGRNRSREPAGTPRPAVRG